MHNIENLIQPNYIRTVKTVSNNNIFQMEVNSQLRQTTKAIRTSNGIVHLCIVHSIKTLGLGVKKQICIQLQKIMVQGD